LAGLDCIRLPLFQSFLKVFRIIGSISFEHRTQFLTSFSEVSYEYGETPGRGVDLGIIISRLAHHHGERRQALPIHDTSVAPKGKPSTSAMRFQSSVSDE